jgi:hypothetical protein
VQKIFTQAPDGNKVVKRFAISRAKLHQPQQPIDAWDLALLRLFGAAGSPVTFDELLNGPHDVESISHVSEDSKNLVAIAMKLKFEHQPPAHMRIWFDPSVNYLACRLEAMYGSDRRKESRVFSFVEVAPGVYFPQHVENKFYSKSNLVEHNIAKFENVHVNETHTIATYSISIPTECQVIDTIANVEYTVDRNGSKVGPVRSLPSVAPLPAGQPPMRESKEERLTAGRMLLPVSVLIVVVAGLYWIYSKWNASVREI